MSFPRDIFEDHMRDLGREPEDPVVAAAFAHIIDQTLIATIRALVPVSKKAWTLETSLLRRVFHEAVDIVSDGIEREEQWNNEERKQ
jgi:hypothetical protein